MDDKMTVTTVMAWICENLVTLPFLDVLDVPEIEDVEVSEVDLDGEE